MLRGDVSQTARANELGVTQSYLSQIERGVRLPSLELLLYLSEKQGTTVGYLLGETGGEHAETRVAESGTPYEEPWESPQMLLASAQQKIKLSGELTPLEIKTIEVLLEACKEALDGLTQTDVRF